MQIKYLILQIRMVGEYGLETLYEVERRRLKSVTDVLVLLTHWEITSSVGLVCVGSGETNTWSDIFT
jgi:hypothetical protein